MAVRRAGMVLARWEHHRSVAWQLRWALAEGQAWDRLEAEGYEVIRNPVHVVEVAIS